jgi:hypothetical protein
MAAAGHRQKREQTVSVTERNHEETVRGRRIAQLEAQNAALVEALSKAEYWLIKAHAALLAALTPGATQAAAAFVARIRAEEREACAKVAEGEAAQHAGTETAAMLRMAFSALARDIRARGQNARNEREMSAHNPEPRP